MEIGEVPVTDRAGAMSVENGTAANIRNFNESDYPQTDFFVRIEQINDPDIRLHDVSLAHVTLLCFIAHVRLCSLPRRSISGPSPWCER